MFFKIAKIKVFIIPAYEILIIFCCYVQPAMSNKKA